MATKYYVINEAAVYREIENEVIVIQTETGRFFYYNKETKPLLDSFNTARKIEGHEDKSHYLNFCADLCKNGIIREVEADEIALDLPINLSGTPMFLRNGEKTLDEITFLCP